MRHFKSDSHLLSLTGKKVFFEPLRGNLGDDLIVRGLEHQLRRNGLTLVSTPEQADHIIIKGGGAFLDAYESLVMEISRLLKAFPTTPTTIMPTSYGYTHKSFADLVGDRTAPLSIFAREKYSFDILNSGLPSKCSLEMDHDSAFHLEVSDQIKKLIHSKQSSHLLIVERLDAESLGVTDFRESNGASPSVSKLRKLSRVVLPQKLRTKMARRLRATQVAKTSQETKLAKHAKQVLFDKHPEFANLPVKAFDVSQPNLFSFDEFCKIVADSAAVYTTRLHVGILSAMLGIPTYLVPGVYHKIIGIYEYSMTDMTHVELVENL